MQTILLVEDNPHIMRINAQLLSIHGYNVLKAATAAEAREQLKQIPADLIVLDMMLPDANGVDLCREFKSIYSIPILFATGMNALSDITAGFRAGCDDYLTKPYDLEELIARIEKLLPPETKEKLVHIEGAEIKVILKYDRKSKKFLESYPDLIVHPCYTATGDRIMLSIEDACPYADLKPGIYKDCSSCRMFEQQTESLLGICRNEKMRRKDCQTKGKVYDEP